MRDMAAPPPAGGPPPRAASRSSGGPRLEEATRAAAPPPAKKSAASEERGERRPARRPRAARARPRRGDVPRRRQDAGVGREQLVAPHARAERRAAMIAREPAVARPRRRTARAAFLSPGLGLATGQLRRGDVRARGDRPAVRRGRRTRSPPTARASRSRRRATRSPARRSSSTASSSPAARRSSSARATCAPTIATTGSTASSVDKYVEGPFATGVVYTCLVVLANPTSSRQRIAALVQIPRGSIAVAGARPTQTIDVVLEPYGTHGHEYSFYFPAPGTWTALPGPRQPRRRDRRRRPGAHARGDRRRRGAPIRGRGRTSRSAARSPTSSRTSRPRTSPAIELDRDRVAPARSRRVRRDPRRARAAPRVRPTRCGATRCSTTIVRGMRAWLRSARPSACSARPAPCSTCSASMPRTSAPTSTSSTRR